jgi:Tfp pilus assembly protein PilO
MKTKNLAVGILAAVLTTAVWYSFLLKPIRSQVSKAKAETETEKSKLEPLQAQLAKAQRDAANEAAFKAQLQSLRLAMPDSPALSAFIRDANSIASDSGVAWQSVTHAAPVAGTDGVMSIAVGITIKGTYPQVMDYLGRIAELQRLVVVDNVQFTAATSSGANGQVSTGGSTGPFSGASSLTVTIQARMFETAGLVSTGAASSSGTSSTPAGGTSSSPAGTSTLNNS